MIEESQHSHFTNQTRGPNSRSLWDPYLYRIYILTKKFGNKECPFDYTTLLYDKTREKVKCFNMNEQEHQLHVCLNFSYKFVDIQLIDNIRDNFRID